MAGYGTGYPVYFKCAALSRVYYKDRTDRVYGQHTVKRTGRTKPTPFNGKGHPRKLKTSHEYACSCGYRGWSSHSGVLQQDLESPQ